MPFFSLQPLRRSSLEVRTRGYYIVSQIIEFQFLLKSLRNLHTDSAHFVEPSTVVSAPSNAAAAVPVNLDIVDLTTVPPASIVGAVGLDGRQLFGDATQDGEVDAICGDNSLKSSNFNEVG